MRGFQPQFLALGSIFAEKLSGVKWEKGLILKDNGTVVSIIFWCFLGE